MKPPKLLIVFAALTTLFVLAPIISFGESSSTAPTSKDELQLKIQEKTQELQSINSQLQEAKKNLAETQGQKQTLQKQVKNYQNTVNQLNLNIKESAVSIQKLNYEIDSLNYDLRDIQASIADKKVAVNKLLLNIQKNDNERDSLLVVFLKNETFADGVFESQSLLDLNSQLKTDINNLTWLNEKYQNTVKEKGGKLDEVQLHQKNLSARMSIVSSQKEEQQALLTQTKSQESVYQKQFSEIQKLQDKVEAEIDLLGQELRQGIDPKLLPTSGNDILLNPVPKGILSQGYGSTSFALKNYRGKWHNGIDLAAPVGTEIYAAADGTVINVGNQDKYCPRAAYGKFVVIKHNNGLATLYAHMSLQSVSIGQQVARGQLIGYVGKTGWATGPHTHFTVFASQTLAPARAGYPEGTKQSVYCGPMPAGGDLNPLLYTSVQ